MLQQLLSLLLSPAVFCSSVESNLLQSMLTELDLEDEQSPVLNKVFGDKRISLVLIRSHGFGAVHGTCILLCCCLFILCV